MISKSKIFHAVSQLLLDKIEVTKRAMQAAQDSANNETKSSAGDKYETGRAMSQNEKDINARHLADLLKMKKALDLIDPKVPMETVELGAIVETDQFTYFISVGLGAIKVGSAQVMTISAISPIGQAMIGKKNGDTVEWNGKTSFIRKVM